MSTINSTGRRGRWITVSSRMETAAVCALMGAGGVYSLVIDSILMLEVCEGRGDVWLVNSLELSPIKSIFTVFLWSKMSRIA